MKKARILLVLGWLWLLSATLAIAQDDFTVRLGQVDASSYPEITLYVGVTDAAGQPVGNLQKDDFSVTEDGRDVDITDFAGVGDIRPVDIVFVFDTTGSMRDEVEGVKKVCIRFADKLASKGRDYRLGLVTFWDDVRGVYGSGGELTDDAQEFKEWIGAIRVGEGDDAPENDFAALKQASQMSFRQEAQKVFILITDAPPHHYGDRPDGGVSFDDPDLTSQRIAHILSEKAISVYAVAYDHPDFHDLAEETGGEFYRIGADFTDIIDRIGAIISEQYRLIYISPRPTYDGTRRDIRVIVGESTGTGDYLEKHLLNIRSNWLIGLILLTPLLLALALPSVLTKVRSRRGEPEMVTVVDADLSPAPPQLAVTPTSTCPHCGHPLRAGARFCSGCGRTLTAPMPMEPMTCPHCGNALRPQAKFCGKCGQRLE